MTQAQCVETLRALFAIERYIVAATARLMDPGASMELPHVVRALQAQAEWLRAGLSLESPEQLSMAEELVPASERTPSVGMPTKPRDESAPTLTADPPTGARVH